MCLRQALVRKKGNNRHVIGREKSQDYANINNTAILIMQRILLFIFLLTTCLYAGAASAPYEKVLSPGQLRADLSQLYEGLIGAHANLYVNISPAQYDTEYDKLKQSLTDPMTALEAQIKFQKFVALGRIGHSRIDFPNAAYDHYRDLEGVAFPIYIEFSGEDWLVSADYSEHNLPKGTRVTHIEHRKVEEWFEDLSQHISADSSAITRSLLEFQLPQYLWLLEQPNSAPTHYSIQVETEGELKQLSVTNISRDELGRRIESAKVEVKETPSLRDYRIIEPGIGYLKPGPFYNAENPSQIWDNSDFVSFIDQAFRNFLDNDVKSLIIDVRNNPGGTNSFSDPLIAWFANKPFRFASTFIMKSSLYAEQSNAKRLAQAQSNPSEVSKRLAKAFKQNPFGTTFEFDVSDSEPRSGDQFGGDVYVLVDRTTYSNAVSLAAIVQDYDFGEVIGESTADFATTYASMETFTLNESGIAVGFPKAHIIRPSGDKNAGPVIVDSELKGHPLEPVIRAIDLD